MSVKYFLLPISQYCLGLDHMTSSKFDLNDAVKNFPRHVKDGENLLKATLVRKSLMIFIVFSGSYCLGFSN